ncbi:hypothetical protein SISNIDRAFT_181666 [Sistotremastrum niveocremeum HHB9708]|uniref:Ricin B lectin domain-containing protein n=1 Tax=Sistotremastrum niveocremeum HHB9708 TaxID=1314777 RepID=A0A164RFN5_9AGAM|nr:hypothetical protein SISNIDRAFT_181666 [Sistotremastrum niveocremeum HHB9708]
MPLDNGLYTIQNAYSSGFLKNTRVDNEVLLYDNGYADQSTVFKLKRIAGNCYTIMLDHTTLRLYVAEAPTATSESGDIVPGPVVAMSSSYSEIELQDAQAGTFRMGNPCSGTYFTLAKDAGNPNKSQHRMDNLKTFGYSSRGLGSAPRLHLDLIR